MMRNSSGRKYVYNSFGTHGDRRQTDGTGKALWYSHLTYLILATSKTTKQVKNPNTKDVLESDKELKDKFNTKIRVWYDALSFLEMSF